MASTLGRISRYGSTRPRRARAGAAVGAGGAGVAVVALSASDSAPARVGMVEPSLPGGQLLGDQVARLGGGLLDARLAREDLAEHVLERVRGGLDGCPGGRDRGHQAVRGGLGLGAEDRVARQ